MAKRNLEGLKPNSNAYREGREPVDTEEVTHKPRVKGLNSSGQIIERKKSPLARFFGTYMASDVDSMKEYAIEEVIKPGILNTVYDMFDGLLSMAFWGTSTGGKKKKREKGESNVSYSAYYKSGARDRRRNDSNDRDSRVNPGDYIFPDRGEAEYALGQLKEAAKEYPSATLADWYDIIEITCDWADRQKQENYGWDSSDLADARIKRVRDGFVLLLPSAHKLD